MTQPQAPQPCAECDRSPAVGAASITTVSVTGTVERWYCHDEESPTCYEIAQRAFGTPGTPFPSIPPVLEIA